MICGKLYIRIFLANSCCVLNVCILLCLYDCVCAYSGLSASFVSMLVIVCA